MKTNGCKKKNYKDQKDHAQKNHTQKDNQKKKEINRVKKAIAFF